MITPSSKNVSTYLRSVGTRQSLISKTTRILQRQGWQVSSIRFLRRSIGDRITGRESSYRKNWLWTASIFLQVNTFAHMLQDFIVTTFASRRECGRMDTAIPDRFFVILHRRPEVEV